MNTEQILATARAVLKAEAEAVSSLSHRLDDNFINALNIIREARGKVVVTGMGKSGIVGKKISATLASTGTPSFFMHPAEAGHRDLGMVSAGDVIVAISNSGETEEIVRLLPFFKRKSIPLISILGRFDSTLANASDVVLDVSVEEEACPLNIVPTSSTTAAIAMGDTLAITLLVMRGFTKEDFATFHPGGSLGRKLLTRVKDLMHPLDALPVTGPHVPIKEAIIEISAKRLGLAIITADDGSLLGIITDGDLRRGLEKWGNSFFDKTTGETMSENPLTIDSEELAQKAVSIMEHRSITSLVVTDKKNNIKGLIHIHDILKSGIV